MPPVREHRLSSIVPSALSEKTVPRAGRPAQLPSCHTQQEHVCGQVCPASLRPYSGLRHSHTSVWDIPGRPSTCGRPGAAEAERRPASVLSAAGSPGHLCPLLGVDSWPRHPHWKQSPIHSTGPGLDDGTGSWTVCLSSSHVCSGSGLENCSPQPWARPAGPSGTMWLQPRAGGPSATTLPASEVGQVLCGGGRLAGAQGVSWPAAEKQFLKVQSPLWGCPEEGCETGPFRLESLSFK